MGLHGNSGQASGFQAEGWSLGCTEGQPQWFLQGSPVLAGQHALISLGIL